MQQRRDARGRLMSQVHCQVSLLSHTAEPLALIYAAFRQCYHAGYVAEMWPRLVSGELPAQKQAEFVERILESGHVSPVEHVSFTFAVAGVSRALTHQLVRHRLASYSQQSQRYVSAAGFSYVVPPSIAARPETLERFESCMREIGKAYDELRGMLEERIGDRAREDARFVLPQAAETRIVITMNCRELLHFFAERCCMRAQWEIREMAGKMLALCRETLPAVFAGAGAKCERRRLCPESSRFACGRYPLAGAPGEARRV